MKYRIIGDTVQTIAIELSANECIFSRLGSVLFVKGALASETAPKGGYWSNISSTLRTEKDPPMVAFRCEQGGGLIGFQAPGPGKIHAVMLDGASRITVKRKNILAATEGVAINPVYLDGEDNQQVTKKLFVTLGGSGWAFLHGPGNLVDFSLMANEKMVVDGSMILLMQGEISYEPRPTGTLSSHLDTPYILLMHLHGPGHVILHTISDT
ncbi:MAG TPA: AIM24 family protein [Firmicutes bacterium]|nr:AIM24 family protein [Bacillota bacterium]